MRLTREQMTAAEEGYRERLVAHFVGEGADRARADVAE